MACFRLVESQGTELFTSGVSGIVATNADALVTHSFHMVLSMNVLPTYGVRQLRRDSVGLLVSDDAVVTLGRLTAHGTDAGS